MFIFSSAGSSGTTRSLMLLVMALHFPVSDIAERLKIYQSIHLQVCKTPLVKVSRRL
jgi:hypothetical protein